ncbi:MAG: nucleoside deaminase [Candidatus Izemoplasmatales bacterium]|jgi:tRNA(adenine34) deaminase|nr:nucleoside deaminase [Candidatus Izemoplasmatales bacterium]
MEAALKQAQKAALKGEVPVGCVIVKDNEIIARGYNLRETSKHVFMHAEMIAMDKACKKLGSWRLDECTIYVTLEPCAMCAGTMIQSRVKRLVYGAKEPKSGVHQSLTNLFGVPFNHEVIVESGLLEEKSSQLLKSFFKELRGQKDLK